MEGNPTEYPNTTSLPEQAPKPIDRLKVAVRRASDAALNPTREATESLRAAYDRILRALPPGDMEAAMTKTRQLWHHAAEFISMGALAADLGLPVLFLTLGGQAWQSRGSLKGMERAFASVATNPALPTINALSDSDSPPKIRALDYWNEPENVRRRRRLGVTASLLGTGAVAWGVGRPVERGLRVVARGAGALGERVAGRMREIQNGDLTNRSGKFQTGDR